MAKSSIQVDYNAELNPLAELLGGIKRPGDFCANGSLEAPMPRLEIEGVGMISFPLLEAQAAEIIRHAQQAPYGRGEETLVDPKVRKVWQVSPEKLRLGGTTWPQTLGTILQRVIDGLGCQGKAVSAELYKLLLYDAGSFFVSHRDTEKAEGMFGTLVIVLPSFHSGGELMVRHAGRELSLDLRTKEVSELNFAAFYADCEHEIRPISEGHRLCLIFNLIQKRGEKGAQKPLSAPDYRKEIAAAAKLLRDWAERPEAPPKLAFLLEHQYSPAGLSFSGLKNADAGVAKVLSEAAQRAGYVVHLGIVHIEESGSAEVAYEPYRGRSRWSRRYSEEEEEESEATDQDFEIIEVCESRQYISNWIGAGDQTADFGEVPLGARELLPQDALDDDPPDSQRVSEATGNEGASFERSYHRAAIVLWLEERYPEVLLQGGVGAVMPYFKGQVEQWVAQNKAGAATGADQRLLSLAELILNAWEADPQSYRLFASAERKMPARAEMLGLLLKLGKVQLVQRFIEQIVIPNYDGSENRQLVASVKLLGSQPAGELLAGLVKENMPLFHGACVELLKRLLRKEDRTPSPDLEAATRNIAGAAVAALSKIKAPTADYAYDADWARTEKAKPLDGGMVAGLVDVLRALKADELIGAAAQALAGHPKVFVADTVLLPALSILQSDHGEAVATEAVFTKLWQHVAEFLLERSGEPPKEPMDWAQPAKLDCRCQFCQELEAFAKAPDERVHRFRIRKDLRQHLHGTIDAHGLDMTHVTERVGSPQTLVCTKTRRTYERLCEQYAKDIESLKQLVGLSSTLSKSCFTLVKKVQQAISRSSA